MPGHYEKMDKIYRYQRGIYDLTRKFCLIGRDRLLKEVAPEPDDNVLEVGCGTARNLILLSRQNPDCKFFGVDASKVMLEVANRKLKKKKLLNITLRHGLAKEFHFNKTFGMDKPFDAIFFSYSLSMVPDWRRAIDNCFANLRPVGKLYILDFWDQRAFPPFFRHIMKWWLGLFSVEYRPELLEYFDSKEVLERGHSKVEPILGRYAFLLKYHLRGS